METEKQTPVVPASEAKPTNQVPATTPAAAKPAETPADELTIPKHRFDEVSEKLRKLEADAAKQAKAQQEADEKRLAESAQWQQLADQRKAKVDELTPKVELADKLSALVLEQYAAEIKDWPEQVRAMAPADDADVLTKLDWMKRAKPLAAELMAGKQPIPGNGRGQRPVGAGTGRKAEKIDPVYDVKRNF